MSQHISNKSRQNKKCVSRCYRYKTRRSYLCDKNRLGKCHIEPEQIDTFGLMNKGELKKILKYYWDDIEMTSTANMGNNRYCYLDKDGIQSNIQKLSQKTCEDMLAANIQYGMWAFFVLKCLGYSVGAITGAAAPVVGPHVVKKWRQGQMNFDEMLLELLKDYEQGSKGLVGEGMISDTELKSALSNLKSSIQKLSKKNKTQHGTYAKRLLIKSKDYILNHVMSKDETASVALHDFLIGQIPDHKLMDVLKGAACYTRDGGKMYEQMSNKPSAFIRFSSHYKNATTPQFGITDVHYSIPLHMVFGTYKTETGETNTWFQLEGWPNPKGDNPVDMVKKIVMSPENYVKNSIDIAKHGGDFITHKIVGQNIGPYGTSNRMDANPIYIKLLSDKTAPNNYKGNASFPNGLEYPPLNTMKVIQLNNSSNINNSNLQIGLPLQLPTTQHFNKTNIAGLINKPI